MDFTNKDIVKEMLNTKGDLEFEIMFSNDAKSFALTYTQFNNMINYIKSLKTKINVTRTLDVACTINNIKHRISIDGSMISKYVNNDRNLFISLLRKKISDDISDDLIKVITKKRLNVYDANEYALRVRLSNETTLSIKDISKLITNIASNTCSIRYKVRASVKLDSGFTIDLTDVKSVNKISEIKKTDSHYELELERHDSKVTYESCIKEVNKLLIALQDTPNIMTIPERDDILNVFYSMVGRDGGRRNPVSLETYHINQLRNKYAVTDKADGERHLLFIYNHNVYLIDGNQSVINTGITLKTMGNSVLDGELIDDYYLIFDALIVNDKDLRGVSSFTKRLDAADAIITLLPNTGFKHKWFNGTHTLNNIIAFHKEQMKEYMNAFKKSLNKKQITYVRKYFIPVHGIDDTEIFQYSSLMWNSYRFDISSKTPYTLDGLIYHPLEQTYTSTAKYDLKEYKWKPPENNSIDFYITYLKDDNGKHQVVFDNVDVPNRPYKIIKLHVGMVNKKDLSYEVPVPFKQEDGLNLAYIFIDEQGNATDKAGNQIMDDTVVEFFYNNDSSVAQPFRWRAMRTRLDKTHSVHKNKRKYGNSNWSADKIWNSIINPVTMKDIDRLASNSKHIVNDVQQYYEYQTDIASPMRAFHNWVKSSLIRSYCNKDSIVLDIGAGRGGDIDKYYRANVRKYVGIDVDQQTITVDAPFRYKKNKDKYPDMSFIYADAGVPLNFKEQQPILGTMKLSNEKLIKSYLTYGSNETIFNRISCQFAIHYFFKNETILTNFMNNINHFLSKGGYFFCTTFDGDTITKVLDTDGEVKADYTDNNGITKTIMNIKPMYDKHSNTGQQIDVLIPMFSNKYESEYVVHKDFFVKEMSTKGFNVVETGMFDSLYELNRDVINMNTSPNKFISTLKDFYNNTNITKASMKIMSLNRFYVFKKE